MPSKETQTCAERSVLRTARPLTTDRDRCKIAFRSDATGPPFPATSPFTDQPANSNHFRLCGQTDHSHHTSHQLTPITRRSSACVT
jgi:hypothetical protein